MLHRALIHIQCHLLYRLGLSCGVVLGDSGAKLASMWLQSFRQLPLLLHFAHAMHTRVSSTDPKWDIPHEAEGKTHMC
jgi:hypothetical protein